MKALDKLSDMDLGNKLSKYPNVPIQAITVTRYRDNTANGLTRAIIRWLELHGSWATRITTTGRQLAGENFTDVIGRTRTLTGSWIQGTTKKGTAEIHAIINGRHVSIEVKVGKDIMSEAQHKTKQAIEACGGIYYMARDFESFVHWYNKETEAPV